MNIYGLEVNEKNCNNILSSLYKHRDRISNCIDKFIIQGLDTTEVEKTYDETCDIISELCEYRRHHDCEPADH